MCTTHQRAGQRRPIYVAITKSNDLAENSLPDKAGSFGSGTTARIVNRTGDNDFVHLMHSNACGIEPLAQFDATIPPVEAIV